MKRNTTLDIIKVIASFGVVFAHIQFPGDLGWVMTNISHFAVPVFFMIAGYYSVGISNDSLKRRRNKIISYLLEGYMVYFIYFAIKAYIESGLFQWLYINVFSVKSIIKMIIFCTVNFATHLWYLIAMLEIYCFWAIINKKHLENKIIKYKGLFLIIGIVINSYCEIKGYPWAWSINFITRGLSWFLIGYYCNINLKETKQANKTMIFLAFFIGIILTISPLVNCLNYELKCILNSVGTIPLSISIFLYGVTNKEINNANLQYMGLNLSKDIYIYHFLVSYFVESVFSQIYKLDFTNKIILYIYPLLVLVLTIGFSFVKYKLTNKLKLYY